MNDFSVPPVGLPRKWPSKIEVVNIPGCAIPGPCWIWHGCRDKTSGYGRATLNKRGGYTHRFVYELLVAPISPGLQIDHLCRQPACCAPHHLEPVTPKVNSERGLRATRTHCPQGHPYSGENLRIHTDSCGYKRRICIQCNREKCREHNARRAAQRAHTWAKYLPIGAVA